MDGERRQQRGANHVSPSGVGEREEQPRDRHERDEGILKVGPDDLTREGWAKMRHGTYQSPARHRDHRHGEIPRTGNAAATPRIESQPGRDQGRNQQQTRIDDHLAGRKTDLRTNKRA